VIVVDASVAAKWLLPEVGSEAALELISSAELLFAPSLIRIEVLAAITRSVRMEVATAGESLTRCEKWLRYLDEGTITLLPDTVLLAEAVQLAIKVRHPLQDCLYLAAAQSMDARLITADRPFVDRIKNHFGQVELLQGCENN
jgi:predicted nucleic acid-binding protein